MVPSPCIFFLWGEKKGQESTVPSKVDPTLLHWLSLPLPPSLTRKLRWHSFQNSHRPSLNSESLEINRQFASQIRLLHKGSLLRLTAFMEKYTVPHKQSWGW